MVASREENGDTTTNDPKISFPFAKLTVAAAATVLPFEVLHAHKSLRRKFQKPRTLVAVVSTTRH